MYLYRMYIGETRIDGYYMGKNQKSVYYSESSAVSLKKNIMGIISNSCMGSFLVYYFVCSNATHLRRML